MIVRKFESRDLEAVLSSWEQAARLAHPFLAEEFLAQERKNLPELYLPNAETWVAEIDGAAVGFVALIGNEIGGLFLLPSHHGKGIGRALVDKAREVRGTLEVEVFSRNSIGRRFYANCGFEEIGESIHEPTRQKVLRLRCSASD
ncbi:putative N-acetyltransferase YjaB [Pirellulimonas nuda]|uniref:Putative N-acetyltransferase YjaB n=1 Tax=Pirellulimonas nuda TaxID=2528009 RepID=A0A518DDA9_9BACT|nr:GNAT family N-acetyltransferase [Pirellulimonas nuda]QDU89459.1 putative N-acetyltransferase YjaB [Pirellulimonas nuda]